MTQNSIKFGNHLLDATEGSLKEFFSDSMEKVSMGLKDVCYEANRPIRQIYFPTEGVISWVQNTGEGKFVEVATVGNEGFVGVPILLGADRTSGTSFCQIPGAAFKISAKDLQDSLATFPELVRILQRYVQALIVQMAQGNACNSAHPVEQRCARWMLASQDRVGQPSFFLTQEFLAQMLGVRRSGVNPVARTFQNAGIIRYARGDLTILDRAALEARSCICYSIVRDEFRRMLRDINR